MATSSTYYLNGPSLGSATAVFTDPDLTLCAADGFYFDGVIVREQVSCVLLPEQLCPACADPCNNIISESTASGGYFEIAIQLGSPTGAVVIEFDPNTIPVGIEVIYNGLIYNELSSMNYGYLAGVANLPTYIGETASDCGIVAGSPYTLDRYTYYGGLFTATPFINTVTVLSSQMDLTAVAPGPSFIVIPKVAASPTTLQINVIAACPLSSFVVTISCPAALGSFLSSSDYANSALACAGSISQTYYVSPVNGVYPLLGLYDWVFSDSSGEFVLPDGFYHAPGSCPLPYTWFKVENGVIVLFGTCVYGDNFRLGRCGDNVEIVASFGSPVNIGDFVAVVGSNCCWYMVGYTYVSPTEVIASIVPAIDCTDCCGKYTTTNTTSEIQQIDYLDCSDVPQTYYLNPGDSYTFCCKFGSIVAVGLVFTFTSCDCP